jgi:hypothetical protein
VDPSVHSRKKVRVRHLQKKSIHFRVDFYLSACPVEKNWRTAALRQEFLGSGALRWKEAGVFRGGIHDGGLGERERTKEENEGWRSEDLSEGFFPCTNVDAKGENLWGLFYEFDFANHPSNVNLCIRRI